MWLLLRGGIIMKKLFYLILFFTLILVGCNSGSVSIDQTFDIPEKVQNVIHPDNQLQLITKGINGYIILQSPETLTLTELEAIDGIIHINFNTENQGNTELKQYIFKMSPGNANVKVLVNGKVTSFDNIIDL